MYGLGRKKNQFCVLNIWLSPKFYLFEILRNEKKNAQVQKFSALKKFLY